MMMTLISMGGNTLSKELMDYQGYDPDVATSSAFVQQRGKILPLAFEFLLQQFTSFCANIKYCNGYRLLAVDGSSLNILAHIERKGWHYVIRVKDASASNSILSGVAA